VANKLKLYRNGVVGFIDWLDLISSDEKHTLPNVKRAMPLLRQHLRRRQREKRRLNRLSYDLRNRAIRCPLREHSKARYASNGINTKREMNRLADVAGESVGYVTCCAINHLQHSLVVCLTRCGNLP